jgi:hypothetical protein
MRTETDTDDLSRALGLQVKFGCQRWIHDRGPNACIQQKFVRAGMVNGHGHDYSGALDESEAYAGSISRAVWFGVQCGQGYRGETDGG